MEKTIKINFKDHIVSFILAPVILVVVFISYNRFIIKHDYIMGYEGVCDPAVNKCFIGCEDDACTKEYYYSNVKKYAADLYNECGKDITDCETANMCLPTDRSCSVTYCDETYDVICKKIEEKSNIQNNNQEVIEEIPLQNNSLNNKNI